MTERDVVLRERAAFTAGAVWGRRHQQVSYVDAVLDDTAARRYPGPKVTRPRAVRIGDKEYRLDGTCIQFRVPCDGAAWCEHSDWRECQRWQPSTRTPEEVRALADLLAQPTETVDA